MQDEQKSEVSFEEAQKASLVAHGFFKETVAPGPSMGMSPHSGNIALIHGCSCTLKVPKLS